jgi:uncharacterized membrane protein YoaK (UPF0700 family)
VPLLAFLATALYAVVNAFGAWLVSRRKPWVAGLFMLSAVILVIAAAAFVSNIPYSRVILVAGLILASVTSYINAEVVIGRVVWRNHLVRALVALALYLLGELAVR